MMLRILQILLLVSNCHVINHKKKWYKHLLVKLMKFINERQCHIIFWTFYSVLINAFFFFISIKAVFVLASNHFRKCFSVNAGVWLRMENKFFRKYFQLTMCFSWFDPEMVWSENFHFKPFPDSCAKRERDRTQTTPRTQSPEPFDFAPFDFTVFWT